MRQSVQSVSIFFVLTIFFAALYAGCDNYLVSPDSETSVIQDQLDETIQATGEISYEVLLIGEDLYSSNGNLLDSDNTVVGTYKTSSTADSDIFRWKSGDLKLYEGNYLYQFPEGINNIGMLAGMIIEVENSSPKPVVWRNATDLENEPVWLDFEQVKADLEADTLVQIGHSTARSLNDNEEIIGYVSYDSPDSNFWQTMGLYWKNTDSPAVEIPLPHCYDRAYLDDINNAGYISGYVGKNFDSPSNIEFAAVVWSHPANEPIFLTPLHADHDDVKALAINEDGDILGSSDGQPVLWRYNNGSWNSPIDLGEGNVWIGDVTDRDENGSISIVGQVNTSQRGGRTITRAAIWTVDEADNIQVQELPLPDGFHQNHSITNARSINNAGWIVGSSMNNNDESVATLWRPISDQDEGDNGNGDEDPNDPDDPEEPEQPEGVLTVSAITYSTHGGRTNDRHLSVHVTLLDDEENAASDVSISIELFHDGNLYSTSTTSTDSNGTANFSFNNAPNGHYTAVVTDVDGDWDGDTPENEFVK